MDSSECSKCHQIERLWIEHKVCLDNFQDVDDYYSQRYPKLYYPGLDNLLFNKKVFALSVAEVGTV